jgi:hypothetical protein
MSQMTLTGSDELELFYKQKFYFSYSGINKLLFSPVMFYNHYILNQREDSTDAHLVAGRVLHCLLLEPSNFDNDFVVLPSKLPSGNNKVVVDNIFKYHINLGNNTLLLEDYMPEILTHLSEMNLHQALKTDQQRIDKILTEENKEYFNFLKISSEKTVIDQTILSGCRQSVEILKQNRDVMSLLQLDLDDRDPSTEVHNELLLAGSIGDLPFGIKGVLDNVVIDNASKTLFVNDLKTTGKPIQDFKDAVDYYRYWIQAVIYVKLALQKYVADEDVHNWTVQVTFIVVDKYNQVYPYQVSLDTLASWQERFETEIVPQIKWHYENKRYDLPYELAIGNVKL